MVVFTCISLITKDVEHFSRCFFAIGDFSVLNFWFSSIPHFLIGLFGFLVVSFLGHLYISDISLLEDVGLVKNFSQSLGCQFVYWLCLLPYRSFQFHVVPFINS